MMVYESMPITRISKEEEIDLEDGEIEDDEEEVPQPVEIPKPVPPKIEPPIIKAPIKEVLPSVNVDKSKKKPKKVGTAKPGLNDGSKAGAEDDWADNVEKAIRAAMGGEIKETDENGEVEDDGEDRKRKKKRKKRHRGDEDGDDRKDSKRRKKHHRAADDEEEADDDEMLFVRGASPIMREHEGQSPQYQEDPYHYADDMRQFDDYSSYDEESEDDFMEGGNRGGRGRGRGRGIRGGGRGGGRKMGRGRGEPMKKRRQQQRDQRQGPDSVCMFFMQGKCQKGDECPYSHDALPPRKMELCKFYLMDCCAKKDKCLYMHHDFPCKYHHTGLKCFAGDRCKFNHGVLTEVLKSILLRHLETAPKEILGDFPRLTREGAAQMVQDKKAREAAGVSAPAPQAPVGKQIPSLFDIQVPVPASMMEGSPRRVTPMPSDDEADTESPAATTDAHSPSKRHKNRWDGGDELGANEGERAKALAEAAGKLSLRQVHEEKKLRWDEEIRKQLEETHKARQGDKTDEEVDAKKKRRAEKEREKTRRREEKKQRREEREGRKWDQEERERMLAKNLGTEPMDSTDPFARQDFSQQLEQMRQRQESAESTQKSRLLKLAGYAGLEPEPPKIDEREEKQRLMMELDDRDTTDRKQSVDESALVIDAPDEEEDEKEPVKEEDKSEGDPAAEIPSHLPRKQQQLFLRIRQQQALREESLKAAAAEAEANADKDDEDWYSSDEETEQASLSSVLKNLSAAPSADAELKRKAEDLTKIADVSDAVNKLLSSIGMLPEPAATVAATAQASPPLAAAPLGRLELPMPPAPLALPISRDPRATAAAVAARDPRKRPSADAQRSPSLYDTAKPRSDPRSRTARRTSSGSGSSVSAPTPSIYSAIVPPESAQPRAQDVDLRLKDTDLRPQGLKDLDLRAPQAFGDLDLRIRPDSVGPDLRQMLGGLPFKPVPAHEAATEIDAGVHSHPPMAYRVNVVCIPPPDYSKLRLSTAEPMARTDPRLRRLFNLTSSSPASPPPASPPPPAAPRADPRRLANQPRDENEFPGAAFARPAFPSPLGPGGGQFGPGPLGPATGLLGPGPGMPGPGMVQAFQGPSQFEDGPDTDLRHFYGGGGGGGKMGGDWNEQAQWEAQQMHMQQEMHMHQMQQQMGGQHPHRGNNRSWRENRYGGRRNNRNDRGGHRNRSYTPPM